LVGRDFIFSLPRGKWHVPLRPSFHRISEKDDLRRSLEAGPPNRRLSVWFSKIRTPRQPRSLHAHALGIVCEWTCTRLLLGWSRAGGSVRILLHRRLARLSSTRRENVRDLPARSALWLPVRFTSLSNRDDLRTVGPCFSFLGRKKHDSRSDPPPSRSS